MRRRDDDYHEKLSSYRSSSQSDALRSWIKLPMLTWRPPLAHHRGLSGLTREIKSTSMHTDTYLENDGSVDIILQGTDHEPCPAAASSLGSISPTRTAVLSELRSSDPRAGC